MWWVSGLENSEIVHFVLVGELGEVGVEIRFAEDFEIHAATGEHDVRFRRNAGLFAEVLRDKQLALFVHVRLADQQRELREQLGLFQGGLVALVDRRDLVVERFLAEHPDQRHAKVLGEHQVKGTSRLGTPGRLDRHPKLRVDLIRVKSRAALVVDFHLGEGVIVSAASKYTEIHSPRKIKLRHFY